ncbi:MAG: bactofilin family protein [Lishizhenia sp.]
MFKAERPKIATDSPDRLNRIVSGSKLEGTLKTESSLRVDGEVIGDLECAGKLVLGEQGKITGNIVAFDAEIEGEVIGNVKVETVLILRASSKINGDIVTGRVVIEDGADFNGTCNMSKAVNKTVKKVASAITDEKQPDVVY